MTRIITRIAPSPTGQMHLGTVRGALYNYLFAKQNNGEFFVRIEDTDTSRNRPEWTEMIWKDFEWCGLVPDKKYIQSNHVNRHQELLTRLIKEDKAYISREPSKNDASKEVDVVRIKNAGARITFTDLIRGEISFDTAELGDFVIARSLSEPLYHFAVVVDDADARVSHVIRGEDILSSTPRHILIQEALGFPRPFYAHLPLILDNQRRKLSKRHHVVALDSYREEGFLPEAIINYLALLGWNPGTDEEYFSLDELIHRFSLTQVHKSGAIFDRTKLLSVNQHWMRTLSADEFILRGNLKVNDENRLHRAVPHIQERAHTFGEAKEMLSYEFKFIFEAPIQNKQKLLLKEPPELKGMTASALKNVLSAMELLPEEVASNEVKAVIMPLADAEETRWKGGRGSLLWAVRVALSGLERSPDPFSLVSILGKQESVLRLQHALDTLSEV